MALLDRLERAQRKAQPAPAPEAAPPPQVPARSQALVRRAQGSGTREELIRQIRIRLQDEVVGAFRDAQALAPSEVRGRVQEIVDRTIAAQGLVVTREEQLQLIDEIVDDLTGYGPLQPLLKDESITEVMVNGPNNVYVERRGKIERIDSVFLNDEHVLRIIDRIITPMGRRIDESSPRVDARLPDGSRVNAIIAPLSLVGPVITIRKFAAKPFTVEDLVRFGTATAEVFEFLKACIEVKLNVFVSGGTGSGKTTTLNVLSSFIPNDERIVTIEDAAELQLRQHHIVTLESRPPNLESEGEITIRTLLQNALHMRPDRIIVGECRSGEALDMLQAMTTGQDGSLSTGHANSPPDMLRRLETMVLMSGVELPPRAIREQIASAVDLIVHQSRLKDGSRKIVNITEVYGIEDDEILTQDIFTFEQTGFVDGKIQGDLKPTRARPTFMGVFEANGIQLPDGEFGIPPEDPDDPGPVALKTRRGGVRAAETVAVSAAEVGRGRTVTAGGMVYITSMGPIDAATGELVGGSLRQQARQCIRNLEARLKEAGTSLDRIVWVSWALAEGGDFDQLNAEWNRWFPGDGPIGQVTVLPPLHRRAGFRVSMGVIAEA